LPLSCSQCRRSSLRPGRWTRCQIPRRKAVANRNTSCAGLLYLELVWNRRVHSQNTRLEMLDTRELTLGVIGPLSLARQSQDLVHDLRGIDRFNGWNNQLHNEPASKLRWSASSTLTLTAQCSRDGVATPSAAIRSVLVARTVHHPT
jgi:hypothetical protein